MKYLVVIPARLKSTRLPDKPLILIKGKEMIKRTYDQCLKVVPSEQVLVATDHLRIKEYCEKNDINVMMTSGNCLTGTDRIAEVAMNTKYDYYINVQGDEPIIDPRDLLKMINAISDFPNFVLNGYASVRNESEYFSSSIPKLVFDQEQRLLYMSRSPIPSNKKGEFVNAFKQVCIYAFPRKELLKFASGQKTFFEKHEDIEILRFVENGQAVKMVPLSPKSIAVDLPEDLVRVEQYIEENNIGSIIWDFDGVILNSAPVREKGFRSVLSSFHKEKVEELIDYHNRNGGLSRYVKFRYFFEEILGQELSKDKLQLLCKEYSKIMMLYLGDKALLIEETVSFIRREFRNIKMYIASGSDQAELRILCNKLGISDCFLGIYGSPKHKTEIVKDIIESSDISISNSVLIGDSINDFEAAQANGLRFYGYNNRNLTNLTSNYLRSIDQLYLDLF